MRALAVLMQLLLIVGAVWTPIPGGCGLAQAGAGEAATAGGADTPDCCAGEPELPAPVSDGGQGCCCRHDVPCSQPCHATLVFALQPARPASLDRELLGVVQERGDRLRGLSHSPEPRPPDVRAA